MSPLPQKACVPSSVCWARSVQLMALHPDIKRRKLSINAINPGKLASEALLQPFSAVQVTQLACRPLQNGDDVL